MNLKLFQKGGCQGWKWFAIVRLPLQDGDKKRAVPRGEWRIFMDGVVEVFVVSVDVVLNQI